MFRLAIHHNNLPLPLKKQGLLCLVEAGENDIQVVEQLDKESCRVVRVTVYDCRKNQAKDDNNEEMDLTMKQQIQSTVQFNCKRIMSVKFIGQDCFIILHQPFQIYFLSAKSQPAIRIDIEPLTLLQTICMTSESNVIVYGHNSSNSSNCIYQVSLSTFDVKIVCDGKKYSPKCRIDCFSLFSADRLYVFGGRNLKGQEVQQLLWTFDFEKGYWFALEMDYGLICEWKLRGCLYENGKVLLVDQSKTQTPTCAILELYQSKVSIINCEQLSQPKHLTAYSMFSFRKRIFFYNQQGITAKSITVTKQKL